MRYDDYNDDYYDDDYDEEEEDPSDETSAYLWRTSPPAQQPAPTATSANDDSLLNDLTAQFRIALNDDTIQEAEIDEAILATDYDVDAAMALLRAQREEAAAAAAAEAARLELQRPSPIGQMVQDTTGVEPGHARPLAALALAAANDAVTVESGTALPLPGSSVEPPEPFRFDQPSPDDLIRAKQAGTGGRKKMVLRIPKASALRSAPTVTAGAPNASASAGIATSAVKTKNNGVTKAQSRQTPAAQGSASTAPPKVFKQRAKKVDISAKVKAGSNSVSVVLAGHVDAGKSTLLGHFLQQVADMEEDKTGKKRRRRKNQDLAWGTDEDSVERERGVTIDIATRVFETSGRKARTYAMIDAPGHRDFVPAMILGATQASAALLVVDASPGEFESGFSEDGQTREHALVLKSLGVSKLIVVVNKIDVANYEEERYLEVTKSVSDFLLHNGWKLPRSAEFVAASGREGLNLVSKPSSEHPLMKWYEGKTVLQAIEDLPSTNGAVIKEISEKPTRLIVSDFFKSASLGGDGSVTGRLLCGSIAQKDKLLICPGSTLASVKNVQLGPDERANVAVAGVDALPVSMGLLDLTDGLIIPPGSVLCDPEAPVPVVTQFRAQLVTVTTSTPLIQGSRVVIHVGGGAEAAAITRLCEYVFNKKSSKAGQKKRRPRRLVKGETAIVEITCERPVAMEKAEDLKALGRFALRQNGRTVGVGIVKDILATARDVQENGSAEIQ